MGGVLGKKKVVDPGGLRWAAPREFPLLRVGEAEGVHQVHFLEGGAEGGWKLALVVGVKFVKHRIRHAVQIAAPDDGEFGGSRRPAPARSSHTCRKKASLSVATLGA